MLCMLVGVGNAWAQSDYSSDYTGNVTLSTTGGTQANTCKVVLNETEYSGIKAGTGKIAGAMKITVPSGTKYLHMHVAGWNGETVKLSVTPSGYSDVIALISNSGISNNSPFTFNGDANTSDYYKVITFNSPLTADTELTFTATTGKRFVVFGVSAENESATPTVAKPTFLPSGGTYAEAQNVTISCTTDGATILYSTDGNTWNTYSSAILVSQTTTIQAKANKEGMNESAVASASYIIEAPSTIADVREQGTGAVFTKGVVTSCVGVTSYIQDATAAICVYGANLTVGDEITVSGTLSTYKGLLEITNPNVKVLSQGNTVSPIVMTIAEINATNAPQGKYVKIVEAVVTAIDGQNTTIEQDGETIIVHGISSDVEYAVGDALTLEGNIGCFDVVQIANPQNVEVKKSEKQEAGLAYETTDYTINIGESFTAPTLTNPNSLTVTYTSSSPDVATVAEDGAVTLTGAAGTTTVTATFTGNDTYLPGSASYTLTIVDPDAPGTEDNPYTVAQVLELYANNNVPATEVYVKGTISRITSLNPPTYKNARYYISDDGTETNEFYVYNGKYLDGADFTSTDQIKVGDEVVIYGRLTSYSGTDEFAAGNYITSLSRPESTDPVINAENVTLDYNATSGEIAYTISNVDEGTELDDATPNADWISGITIASDKVTFTTTANEGTEDRTATITLTYGDVTKDVTVTQGHYVAPVIDYATLPFAFDGGRADIANTVGLSQDGLDSDYGSSPKLKFNSTDDVVILHFNEQPGTLSFDIKGNSFSGGSFTVQTSVDGVTYTNLKSYTSLASTVQSEIFEDLDADIRYIKWVFTEKSSGNVALGNIILAKYTVKQDATVSFKKDGDAITTLEANLNAEIEVAVECSVEGAELNITSSNSRVAKYEDGVVKALAEGEATITATFAGNDEYKSATATLAVTVVDNRGTVNLAFNDIPAEININETATYAVTATPAVEGITYSSSAPAVVSVDETTGAIEALAVGTATITANFAGNDSYKAATATYTIKVVNPDFAASKYELVADATTLKAGDEIVFVNIGSAKVSGVVTNFAQAMAAKGNNIFNATDITVNDDNTILSNAETSIFTLEGTDGAWSFKLGSEYLAATGMGTQNYLGTSTIVEDASTATIVINEGEASVTFASSNRNVLSHNFNSGNARFSCYSAKQNGLQIYRKVTSSEEPLKGDVNKDGFQTIADVTALVNIILGKATPDTNPDYDFDAADVNGDGGVPTIADVTALVNIILGKE